jgi:hypothetical protein
MLFQRERIHDGLPLRHSGTPHQIKGREVALTHAFREFGKLVRAVLLVVLVDEDLRPHGLPEKGGEQVAGANEYAISLRRSIRLWIEVAEDPSSRVQDRQTTAACRCDFAQESPLGIADLLLAHVG